MNALLLKRYKKNTPKQLQTPINKGFSRNLKKFLRKNSIIFRETLENKGFEAYLYPIFPNNEF